MPLRGALFKRIFATRKEREGIEKKQLASHFRQQSQELAKIRKKRIEEQGRAKLRGLLADEKRMLKAAKSPSKISRFEGFLAGQAKRGLTAAEIEAKKRIKKQLRETTTQKSVRKTKRKGKKRKKKKPSGLFDF